MLSDIVSELTIEKVETENADDLYVAIDRVPVWVESPGAVPFYEELHRGTLRECVEVLLDTAFKMALAYHIADTHLNATRSR